MFDFFTPFSSSRDTSLRRGPHESCRSAHRITFWKSQTTKRNYQLWGVYSLKLSRKYQNIQRNLPARSKSLPVPLLQSVTKSPKITTQFINWNQTLCFKTSLVNANAEESWKLFYLRVRVSISRLRWLSELIIQE